MPGMGNPDRRADFDTEVVSLIPALRAFARTFHPDASDADDLVQETLTKAIANSHQFTPGTRLKSWLFTIMRNSFYNNVVAAKREITGAAECASSRPAVDPTQDWTLRGRELARAIDRLPRSQREVIVLIGVLGTSYEDTSRICDCAIGTVKSRLYRARARLVVELGEKTQRSCLGN